MRLFLDLLVLALAALGMGALIGPHVPATLWGAVGIVGVVGCALLIGVGFARERG